MAFVVSHFPDGEPILCSDGDTIRIYTSALADWLFVLGSMFSEYRPRDNAQDGELAGAAGAAANPTDGRCGVNPVTGNPGFTRDPVGQPGHLRAPILGEGQWGARRPRNHPPRHTGLDIAGELNVTPIRSNRAGTVTYAGNAGGNGGYIVAIDYPNNVRTQYMHLQADSILVATYQRVTQGQQIGTLGNTGNAGGTPPHVHFAVSVANQGVDPATYLNSPCPQ